MSALQRQNNTSSPQKYSFAGDTALANDRFFIEPVLVKDAHTTEKVEPWSVLSGNDSSAASTWAASVASMFVLRQPDEIRKFLDSHQFLYELLAEAREVVSRHFGFDIKIALELVHDPEGADEEPELVAFVQIDLPPSEALDKLDQIDKTWWLDAMPRARQKFSVNLEYV